MKLVGIISTAVLSLTLGAAAPAYAQQEEKHTQQEEKKAQQDKPAQQEEKHAQQGEKKAQQDKPAQRDAQHEQQAQRAGGNGRRISDDRFRANFGREHVFVINRPVIIEGQPRFQYGGYWFGFVEPWPVGWYYTDNVYVDYIDGGYYLYNPVHPGIRIVINVF
jgi:hypothetical protein